MPEELCQVPPKSHYVSLALHSDPSPLCSFCFSCAVGYASSGFAASAPVFATVCSCYSLYSLSCPHIPYTEHIFSCFSCLSDRIICKAWLLCASDLLLFKSNKRIYKTEDAVGTLRGCHLAQTQTHRMTREILIPSGGNWSGEAYTTAGSRNLITMRGSSTTKS